jgi:hypothetical protein
MFVFLIDNCHDDATGTSKDLNHVKIIKIYYLCIQRQLQNLAHRDNTNLICLVI